MITVQYGARPKLCGFLVCGLQYALSNVMSPERRRSSVLFYRLAKRQSLMVWMAEGKGKVLLVLN
jgi:hypothetical protein